MFYVSNRSRWTPKTSILKPKDVSLMFYIRNCNQHKKFYMFNFVEVRPKAEADNTNGGLNNFSYPTRT